MRLIDANALMEYCNNLKDKTIDANDIARFPTADVWYRLEEKLPAQHEKVLVAYYVQNDDDDRIYCMEIASLDGEDWEWDNPDGHCFVMAFDHCSGIYAWTPLPEPPELEEDT